MLKKYLNTYRKGLSLLLCASSLSLTYVPHTSHGADCASSTITQACTLPDAGGTFTLKPATTSITGSFLKSPLASYAPKWTTTVTIPSGTHLTINNATDVPVFSVSALQFNGQLVTGSSIKVENDGYIVATSEGASGTEAGNLFSIAGEIVVFQNGVRDDLDLGNPNTPYVIQTAQGISVTGSVDIKVPNFGRITSTSFKTLSSKTDYASAGSLFSSPISVTVIPESFAKQTSLHTQRPYGMPRYGIVRDDPAVPDLLFINFGFITGFEPMETTSGDIFTGSLFDLKNANSQEMTAINGTLGQPNTLGQIFGYQYAVYATSSLLTLDDEREKTFLLENFGTLTASSSTADIVYSDVSGQGFRTVDVPEPLQGYFGLGPTMDIVNLIDNRGVIAPQDASSFTGNAINLSKSLGKSLVVLEDGAEVVGDIAAPQFTLPHLLNFNVAFGTLKGNGVLEGSIKDFIYLVAEGVTTNNVTHAGWAIDGEKSTIMAVSIEHPKEDTQTAPAQANLLEVGSSSDTSSATLIVSGLPKESGVFDLPFLPAIDIKDKGYLGGFGTIEKKLFLSIVGNDDINHDIIAEKGATLTAGHTSFNALETSAVGTLTLKSSYKAEAGSNILIKVAKGPNDTLIADRIVIADRIALGGPISHEADLSALDPLENFHISSALFGPGTLPEEGKDLVIFEAIDTSTLDLPTSLQDPAAIVNLKPNLFYTASVHATAKQILLNFKTISNNGYVFDVPGLTSNEHALAIMLSNITTRTRAIDGNTRPLLSTTSNLLTALYNSQNLTNFKKNLKSLDGQIYGDIEQAAISSSERFTGTSFSRLPQGDTCSIKHWCVNISPLFYHKWRSSYGDQASVSTTGGGWHAMMLSRFLDNLSAAFSFQWDYTKLDIGNNLPEAADAHNFNFGAFMRYTRGTFFKKRKNDRFYAQGGVQYTVSFANVDRTVSIVNYGTSPTLPYMEVAHNSTPVTNLVKAVSQTGYNFDIGHGNYVGPYARLDLGFEGRMSSWEGNNVTTALRLAGTARFVGSLVVGGHMHWTSKEIHPHSYRAFEPSKSLTLDIENDTNGAQNSPSTSSKKLKSQSIIADLLKNTEPYKILGSTSTAKNNIGAAKEESQSLIQKEIYNPPQKFQFALDLDAAYVGHIGKSERQVHYALNNQDVIIKAREAENALGFLWGVSATAQYNNTSLNLRYDGAFGAPNTQLDSAISGGLSISF